ncbi:MAG: DnaJ domain-containing protein, partial [Candidatus Nitrosoglobus sp.]
GRLKGPLPEPFHYVLRLAAGKVMPEIKSFASQWDTNPEELRKAAVFYIEQACLSGENDPYRVLGLNPSAESHSIQIHYHFLMLLFHPDRAEAAMGWREIYATRINDAYRQLRKLDGRQAYEQSLAVKKDLQENLAPVHSYQSKQKKNNFLLYVVQRFPIGIRYLPQLILWSGIGITVSLVVNLYLAWTRGETVKVASQPEKKLSSAEFSSQQKVALRQENSPPQALNGSELPLVKAEASLLNKMVEKLAEEQDSGENRLISKEVAPGGQKSIEVARASSEKIQQSAPTLVQAALPITSKHKQEAQDKPLAKSAAPPLIQQEAVRRLLKRFISTYQQGDLDGFIALFSPDAHTNDYFSRSAIRQDYAQFFSSTQARKLLLKDFQWRIKGNTAQGGGRYIARVRKASGIFESQGQIHLQVQNLGGANLITRFFNTIESVQRDVSTPK